MERKGENGKNIFMPPTWCSAICRNAMNDVCVEKCAPARDCSSFEIKQGLNIEDMPRFPLKEFTEEMTAKERMVSVGVYTAKLVDAAQGVKDERKRPPLYRSGNGRVFKDLPKPGVPSDFQKGITLYQAEPSTDSSEGEGPNGVDRTEG